MIPKRIHYCWFGRGEKPALARKCIASWKKYCPDYEIVEWNEDNFDIGMNAYTKYCYDNKKWAFLSDYVRLLVVYEHGGVYFDTDVEVIRSFDFLLQNEAFVGFEEDNHINTGVGFGSEKHGKAVERMIQAYDILLDGEHGVIGCPILNTQAMEELGMIPNGKKQVIAGCTVLPKDYLNPYDDPTGRLLKTEHTYSIHWYAKSWLDKKTVFRSWLTKPLHRLLGKDFFRGKSNK